jgi:hypothetical protein
MQAESSAGLVAWEGSSVKSADYLIDFPENNFPERQVLADDVRRRMARAGFALCRNWPLGINDIATAENFAEFGRMLGDVRAQDGNCEWWRFVQDQPNGTSGSTGRMEISLHTENARPPGPPRMIGLFCIRPALRGGDSMLASGPAILRRLRAKNPEYVATLQNPVPFGRRRDDWIDGRQEDWQPVFSADGDPFNFRYSRYWIDLALEQSEVELDPAVVAAANAVDHILQIPEVSLKFSLRPGDALLVDNRVVMHGREEFDDDDENRRRLVRIWID